MVEETDIINAADTLNEYYVNVGANLACTTHLSWRVGG